MAAHADGFIQKWGIKIRLDDPELIYEDVFL